MGGQGLDEGMCPCFTCSAPDEEMFVCPGCGFQTFDGTNCHQCSYTAAYGPCPDCESHLDFDGMFCSRCGYHVPPFTEASWRERMRYWIHDRISAIRARFRRHSSSSAFDDELPF